MSDQWHATKTSQSPQVQFTSRDLDVEDAEGEVLRSVQEKHGLNATTAPGQQTPPSSTKPEAGPRPRPIGSGANGGRRKSDDTTNTSTGVVQRRIKRLEAAVLAQKAASCHSASHRLHDMIAEEETGIGAYVYRNRRGRGGEEDGLMKAAMAAHRNTITPRNPYGSNYDHHFLKGRDNMSVQSMSIDDSERRHRLGIFRRVPKHSIHSAGALPMHQSEPSNGLASSDYIATNSDGEVYPGYTRNSLYATGRSHYSYPHLNNGSGNNNKHRRKLPRWVREICALFHPYRIFANCLDILVKSQFLWIGFPCLMGSAICFYLLDNPRLHALPGETTIAVWLLFATRQTVTLGLAQLTVYVVIDGLMLGTHLAVQTLGPLVTLTAATGNGWPAMMTMWGCWNFVIIHGDSPFQLNWLYWTQMGLFNQNFGGLLVNSVFYTRVLLAAIMLGLFVSAKRTIFALRFGRKQVAQFKPRLKRILADVVLLDEISTLAESADKVEEEQDLEQFDSHSWDNLMMSRSIVQQGFNELLWHPKIEYQNSNTSDVENESTGSVAEETASVGNTKSEEKRTTFAECPPKTSDAQSPQHSLRRSDSGSLKINEMLDSWEEPDSTTDKTENISIHEILKFRRALSHLEENNIFGDAFGSTATRDQCIANSHKVYYRLLKLAEESDHADSSDDRIKAGVLPFDVLALLCLGDDGSQNLSKKRKIRKLFIPDRSGDVPLLAFIQAIDQCYKRLVFLRASLRNASLLDGVLEKLFNGIFYFMLFLFLSSILQLHPWTLMVSLTSILVSVSFALGSSVSGYVEGVLLIAVRRPFDLGDRIFMSSADSINPLPDVTKNSWFVEDISLATTTLRHSYTNECCTVNNSSIASTRIVNLARSPNATVHFEFAAHISILEDDKLEGFRKEIQRYVEERPRVWESIASIRHGMFDADDERVDLSMALRHRNAWQEAGRIKNDRADAFRFLYRLGNKLNIHFSAPPEQKVIYQGGLLRKGDTDHARDLLSGSNIRPIGPECDGIFQPSNARSIG